MIQRIQIISIIGSILFLIFIFELIRRKKIKESYSLIWLTFSFVFIFFSIWKEGLDYFAAIIGIYYPPSFLLLLLIFAVILLLVQVSVIISSLDEKVRILTQELTLLKTQINKNEKKQKNN